MKIPEFILKDIDLKAEFDEIAAIYEYDARINIKESERLAILDLLSKLDKNNEIRKNIRD
jgi:hypothetical protein